MLGRCDLDDLAEVSPAEQMRRAAERRARLFNRPAPVRAQPPVERKPTVVAFVPRRARDPLDVEVAAAEPAWHRPHDFMAIPDEPDVVDQPSPVEQPDCLVDEVPPPRTVKVRHVVIFACEYFAILPRDLMSDRRFKRLVEPRQMAIWLCHRYTSRSLPDIARRFGDRDHTTILHAIRKIDGEIARETDLGRRALQMEAAFLTSRPDLVG